MDKDINTPLVSVIMPGYNASDYIQEAIDSVVTQTFFNWELIIIDDGSTDGTKEIVKKNISIDNRISYHYQENGKQGKARNLGISKSKGKYLAFLDADDIWQPEKLEFQLKEIVEYDVDLVFSNCYIFCENEAINVSKKMNTINAAFSGIEGLEKFILGNRIPILTVLMKRNKIALVNGFSEKLSIQNAEDYHLWLKLLIQGCKFYGSDKIFASYRLHHNASTNQDKNASKQIPEVFLDLANEYPNFKLSFKKALKDTFKSKYANNVFTKADLNEAICNNYKYLQISNNIFFYKALNFLLPTKITKRFLIHFLNA